nr:unnamed protein product [Callosobruchus analis]
MLVRCVPELSTRGSFYESISGRTILDLIQNIQTGNIQCNL